jgi:glyoxylase-like metal-dependent hydrolase (beta-lactamase superfamily II)
MAKLFFKQLKARGYDNFSYIVGDKESGQAAVIDPPYRSELVLEVAAKNNLKILYIIDTHAHYDHVQGNESMKKATGARIVAHESSVVRKDLPVKDGDIIKLDGIKLKIIHTPGHSPDGVSLLVDDKLVMTGDTLFVGECGRTDLPGSDPLKLYESLTRLTKLPDSVEVYPGHDYGSKPHSTIGYEKSNNYTLKPRTREEFVRFMEEP